METFVSPFCSTSDSDLYNGTSNGSNPSMNNTDDTGFTIYISVIASIEIPFISLAIYVVCSLIKSKKDASVFVINLLISDLVQIVSISLEYVFFEHFWRTIFFITIEWTCVTGVYFMTCIAVERYVLIAHPVWHRSHRSVKFLVCTSLTGWLVSLIVIPIICINLVLLYFIPLIFYPVIILSFVGACSSLSHSMSLSPLKKQLALAPLFFVVMSYTFLILPVNIVCIVLKIMDKKLPIFLGSLLEFTYCFYLLYPLVDCLLYVYMRSDSENILRIHHCCTRLKRVQSETRHTTSTDAQHDHV